MIPLGDIPAGVTYPFAFPTYGSSNESITITGLSVTDIEIYKAGSTTQRSSDNGYALLDTDGIDFDSTTGIHGFSVDFSDNSDSGFYAAGSFYWLVVNAITVNAQTVRLLYTFRLVAAESSAGTPKVDVSHWLGTAAATPTVAGVPEVDVTHYAGSTTDVSTIPASVAAILVDTGTTLQGELDGIQADTEDIQSRLPAALVGGRIDANMGAISSDATAADNAESFFDGTGYAGTNNVIPTVTTLTNGVTLANGAHGGASATLVVDAITVLDAINGDLNGSVLGSVAGNVDGSVGSVTGAVGSVTGNVGGNVVGSVASVTGGINTAAGTIQTLDALDTAQDTQHGTTQTYLTNNLGSAGAAATEAGGTGDHLTALATQASVDTIDGIVDAILMDTNELQTNQGNWLTATGFSTHSAADVWSVATRLLTAGTNIVLAKGTGITGFNDISVANILSGFNTNTKPANGDPATWTWLEAQWMLNRRFFAKTVHDSDAGTITVHDFDAGKTAITEQLATTVGNVETQDEAATP